MARILFSLVLAVIALSAAAPGLAQSTNAPVVLVTGSTPLDAASLALDDAAKKNLSAYLGAAKPPGTLSVFVASADLKVSSYYVQAAGLPGSIADTARVALELCEFSAKAPCLILSINGMDAREPGGGWPVQPKMLSYQPGSKLDVWTIPFSTEAFRANAANIPSQPFPIALVVTNAGGWTWAGGKDVFEAIATAGANCAKTYPTFSCILYSVNNTVVWTP